MKLQPGISPDTRPSLIHRLKDETDDASWSEFHRIYGGYMEWLAMGQGLNETEAKDVRQIVYVHLVRSLKTFELAGRKGAFRAFLRQRMKWSAAEFHRSKDRAILESELKRHDESSGESPLQKSLEASVDDSQRDEEEFQEFLFKSGLEELRKTVSSRDYQWFDLRKVQGWPVKEIVRMSKNATENMVSIACSRLQDDLEVIVRRLRTELDE